MPNRSLQIKGFSTSIIALEKVLDEIPVGIMILGLDKRVVLVNRTLEAITGFLAQEAQGISCAYILRGNLCCHGCKLKEVSENKLQVCSDANIINRNRQKISVRLTTAPILDQNGNTTAFLETVEDLSLQEAQQNDCNDSFLSGKLVGVSNEMRRVFKVIPVIAQTDSSVLITGQTGTGKDVVAEAIHQASGRAKGPFIKINCGALPESLLESELFGHQKGAFTGAIENRPGRFRLAHNGTVYLTEIGDLPLNLQVKLLSFLDDKVVYPLGSTKGHNVDVRVIAATHRPLEKMVQQGLFREDLLFRLNVIRLHLPPLVRRHEDLKILQSHFLQTFNKRFNKQIRGFSDDARDILHAYGFPGNVRELRNIVEYAVNICEQNEISAMHLPEYVSENIEKREVPVVLQENGIPERPVSDYLAQPDRWNDAEKKLIMDAMIKCRGRKTEAAKILGYCRATLWRKMKRYGILE